MCTAVSFLSKDHYFGRNLDLEYHYNESVVVTPRNAPLPFRCQNTLDTHYAMIGMAIVEMEFPLYYEATNEHGLSMAGLNFPGNAFYFPANAAKNNIAPFELIPWILGQCANIPEARRLLEALNIVDIPFNSNYPLSPLHWMVSDRDSSIVVEQTRDGLFLYDNPIGVLTNNPPFPYHRYNLQNYMQVTAREPENRFSKELSFTPYSRGMGGVGLPGDLSSASRFVRAAFIKENSICESDNNSSISQFFHILDSVAQQRGCVHVDDKYEITYYSSCCNTDTGVYYYKTYDNAQITAIAMNNLDRNNNRLIAYPIVTEQQIRFDN